MKRTISILMVAVMCLSLGACGKKNEEEKSSSEKYIYDEKFANSNGFYVAGEYIYQNHVQALKRIDKGTSVSEHIAECYNVVAVTDDCIYFNDDVYLYKLPNDSDEPERLYEMFEGVEYFLDGDYIYTVDKKGSVIRNINSKEKYEDSTEVIYNGSEQYIEQVKFYKDHIYYLKNYSGIMMQISIKDGSSREIMLPDWDGKGYYFYKDNIIYNLYGKGIYKIAIDEDDVVVYDKYKNLFFDIFLINGFIYAGSTEGAIKIDLSKNGESAYKIIESEDIKEKLLLHHSLVDIGTGIMCYDYNSYFFFDYDGNPIK